MIKNILALCMISCLLFASCKSRTDVAAVEEKIETTAAKTGNKYTLVAFKPSTEYADATINSYTYKDGKFDFNVSGTDYKLGEQTPDAGQKMCANSGKGQHIHLIVNDKPYAAKYTSSFEHEIEDGIHLVLAFLSRSYHESIKTDAASNMQRVYIKDGTIERTMDITDPILFYSRPKGTYVGKDTEKVMLDFFLGNTMLEEHKVIAKINGEEHTIDKWQPYYIKGLPMGENTVTLTLVDNNGEPVKTKLNPVTRKFTLKADPAG